MWICSARPGHWRKTRYITCLPEYEDDNDCHVVNEVWLPELGKWAMVDTDMNHYITDADGTQLSLREIREHFVSGEKMVIYSLLKDHYINIMPAGYETARIGDGNTITTDAERFWAALATSTNS